MSLSNEIVLRPRFKKSLALSAEEVLTAFESAASTTKDFNVSRVDGHVFIRILKREQHFWSPQLHLEITEDQTNGTILKGLFGPNPTVWTMFMFFHFILAVLFIAAGIWLYTNITLQKPFVFPLVTISFIVLFWFVLYTAGRLGKKRGNTEMNALYAFMTDIFSAI
tara:strand:- start:1394 stop:1891 length:498 start_codon:yes stop_codon:yes gene_type:complete